MGTTVTTKAESITTDAAASVDIGENTQSVSIENTQSNIALNKPATASSYLGGNTPTLAFDGDAGTRYESEFSDPQWISVDLGSNYSVTGVKLNWETAAGKDYKIQVSADNINWDDAYTKTGGIEDITSYGVYVGSVSVKFKKCFGLLKYIKSGFKAIQYTLKINWKRKTIKMNYRELMISNFSKDPMKCLKCGELISIINVYVD